MIRNVKLLHNGEIVIIIDNLTWIIMIFIRYIIMKEIIIFKN